MILEQDYIRFLLAFLTAILPSTSADVLELTDINFYPTIALHEHTLVLFYAPWCKRSQILLPEYDEAAEEIIKYGLPLALFKVDCTEASDDICTKFAAEESYPKLKIFDGEEFIADYRGARTSNGIVKYMEAYLKPGSKELSCPEDLAKLIESIKEPIVVGFFTSESSLKTIFQEISEQLKIKINFVYLQSNEDKVILYRPLFLTNKFENSSLTYSSNEATVADLSKFILKHMHGLVGIRTLDNEEDFQEPLIIVYFAIDYELNPKATNYWRNRVLMIAKDFEEKVNFAISSNDEFAEELGEFNIDFIENKKPFVIAKRFPERIYILKEEFSVDSLRNFANNFLDGNLQPHFKSEPIPTAQTEKVIVTVANSFDDIVGKNDKDTLIEFYAPWCGHCQTLAPIYKELAEKLEDENVAIVKMDAVANDVPSPYKVNGYPTIYWAPKNKKNYPVKYTGRRTINDFIKFIAKEATEELKGWDREGNAKEAKIEL